MTLHMIQMEPDLGRLMRWATGQNLLPARGEADTGYVLHAALAAAFATLAPKPFALDLRRHAVLLGYAAADAAALRSHAASFAAPDVHELLGVEGLASKPMPPLFAAGTRLGFAVLARPTQRTDRDGDRDRIVEKDALLLAPPGSDRGTVYADWLTRRLQAGGARPIRVVLESFRLSRVRRRDAERRLRDSLFPEADFSGTLEVADPAGFAALLARGIGRHRAFGFGMLLLRPS